MMIMTIINTILTNYTNGSFKNKRKLDNTQNNYSLNFVR